MTTDIKIRDRFWEELDKSPILMLGLSGTSDHSQPMTAKYDGHNSPLWFYTTRDNRLVTGLNRGGQAMAQYVAKGHDFFGCVHGRLAIDHDPALIDHFWSRQVEAWYPESRNDPTLVMLRFDLQSAELWLADISVSGTFRMLFGGDLREEARERHAEVVL